MPHKVKLVVKSPDGEGPAQGFDADLFLNGEPFEARKVTIVAEAGRPFVRAIVEFGVSQLEFEGDVELFQEKNPWDGVPPIELQRLL